MTHWCLNSVRGRSAPVSFRQLTRAMLLDGGRVHLAAIIADKRMWWSVRYNIEDKD